MSFDQISMGKKYVLNEARGKINWKCVKHMI
jgi:hypothetical protein